MRFGWSKADRSPCDRRFYSRTGHRRRAAAGVELLEERHLLAVSGLSGGSPFSVAEQTEFAGQVVATINDPSAAASDYAAMINWGDGSSSAGQVVDTTQSGVFQVLGAHTYADEGAYAVQAVISKDGGFPLTVAAAATVTDPPLSASGGYTVAAVEGTPPGSQVLATFIDPAPEFTSPLPYSATIDWGDGKVTAGAISYNAALGEFQVTGGGDHTYASYGTQTIKVTLKHDSTPSVTVSDAAIISDPAIVAQGGFTYVANEGATPANQVLASFTDPGGAKSLDHYSATIDWGDGNSAPGTLTANGNQFSVLGAHAYAEEGSGVIQVVINHDANPAVTVSSLYSIDDPAVQLVAKTLAGTEGAALSGALLATFTDPGGPEAIGDYSAQIDWGDGVANSGTISFSSATGVFSVTGSHVYSSPGEKTVKVTVHHDDAPDAVATTTAAVSDVPLDATAASTFAGIEGATSPVQTLATFSDPGVIQPLSAYGAMIDWGDGAAPTAGVVRYDGGSQLFTVSGQHAYAEEGNYLISVVINDSNATSATVTLAASVSDAAVRAVAVQGFSAVEYSASAMQPLATFVDPAGSEPTSDYSATINWGDGTTSSGQIVADAANGSFSVMASHVFASSGLQSPIVTIHHDNAPDATVTAAATVSLPAIQLHPLPTTWVEWATYAPNPLATLSFTDSQMTATIYWGDGATSAGSFLHGQLGGVGAVRGTHVYTEAAYYTVTIVVTDGPQTVSCTVPMTVLRGSLPIADPNAGTPNEYYVAELYEDVLKREPDGLGLLHWAGVLDNGAPRSAVADALLTSNEYLSRFVIGPAYEKYLGRAVDPAGLEYWIGQMQHGLSDAGLTASLAASPEFYVDSGNSNLLYVGNLYQKALGRQADPQGQAYWAAQLNAGRSRNSVALAFMTSGEQLAEQVQNAYESVLNRSPDTQELNSSISMLAQGALSDEGLIARLAATDEYFSIAQSEPDRPNQ